MEDLGYQTDFFFLSESKFTQRPNYLGVLTKQNPTFFYGNFLLLDNPPKENSRKDLELEFDQFFTGQEERYHYTFCWKGAAGKPYTEFIEAGYELNESSVLIANKSELVRPNKLNEEVQIREFKSEEDWLNWVELELKERPPGHEEQAHRKYLKRKVEAYLKLNKQGLGNFYGAYLNKELVASAGLFSNSCRM